MASLFASPDFSTGQDAPPLQVKRLSDAVSVVSGDGGNIAVITGDDGLMLIDSGLATRIGDLLTTVAEIDAQRVRMLFNTHWHFDHTGGNEVLGKGGAKIIAHENVRKRMSAEQHVEAMNQSFPPSPAVALPTEVFAEGGSLNHGSEHISYARVPPAHTDGDAYVFFARANVLLAGDLFFNGFYPIIDYSSGGWLGGMVAASDTLLSVGDGQTRIIPGHGPVANPSELKATRDMLAKVYERLLPLYQQGRTVDEVVAAAPTRDLDARWGNGMMKPEEFVRAAYTSILRHH